MNRIQRILAAAAEGTGDYPLDPRTIIYRKVLLAVSGTFHPYGAPPEGVTFDQAYFAELAANYDPLWFAGTLNCDHPELWVWPPYGAASGIILNPTAEDGKLYADLAVFDWWLADELDRGKWPTRSIEWHDEKFCGGHKFYDKFDKYLTGLAFLGLDKPAVPGLGPLPARESDQRDELPAEPTYYALPLAASAGARGALRLVSNSPQEESLMKDEKQEQGSPPAADQALAAKVAALEQENAALKAGQQTAVSAENSALAARISALEAENASLRAAENQRAIDTRVAALKASKTLTPATEPLYRSLAATLAQPAAACLKASLADGAELAPLDLVDKLLASMPHPPASPVASGAPRQPAAVEITAADREVGKQLRASGSEITDEQIAEQRLANKRRANPDEEDE